MNYTDIKERIAVDAQWSPAERDFLIAAVNQVIARAEQSLLRKLVNPPGIVPRQVAAPSLSSPHPSGAATVFLTILMKEGDTLRQVCGRCVSLLEDAGMVTSIFACSIDWEEPSAFTTVTFVYDVIPPYTLAQCRDAIADVHYRHRVDDQI